MLFFLNLLTLISQFLAFPVQTIFQIANFHLAFFFLCKVLFLLSFSLLPNLLNVVLMSQSQLLNLLLEQDFPFDVLRLLDSNPAIVIIVQLLLILADFLLKQEPLLQKLLFLVEHLLFPFLIPLLVLKYQLIQLLNLGRHCLFLFLQQEHLIFELILPIVPLHFLAQIGLPIDALILLDQHLVNPEDLLQLGIQHIDLPHQIRLRHLFQIRLPIINAGLSLGPALHSWIGLKMGGNILRVQIQTRRRRILQIIIFLTLSYFIPLLPRPILRLYYAIVIFQLSKIRLLLNWTHTLTQTLVRSCVSARMARFIPFLFIIAPTPFLLRTWRNLRFWNLRLKIFPLQRVRPRFLLWVFTRKPWRIFIQILLLLPRRTHTLFAHFLILMSDLILN